MPLLLHNLNERHVCNYFDFPSGPHTIDIYYDGVPIVGSPFAVNVKRGTDASKCRAYGPGLTKGIISKVNAFTVETKGENIIIIVSFITKKNNGMSIRSAVVNIYIIYGIQHTIHD